MNNLFLGLGFLLIASAIGGLVLWWRIGAQEKRIEILERKESFLMSAFTDLSSNVDGLAVDVAALKAVQADRPTDPAIVAVNTKISAARADIQAITNPPVVQPQA